MKLDLTNPIYHNEDMARAHLEGIHWPNGPRCAHCSSDDVTRMQGKSHRKGLIHCNECGKPFTVTVNAVMERSKIPDTSEVLLGADANAIPDVRVDLQAYHCFV